MRKEFLTGRGRGAADAKKVWILDATLARRAQRRNRKRTKQVFNSILKTGKRTSMVIDLRTGRFKSTRRGGYIYKGRDVVARRQGCRAAVGLAAER